MGLSSRLLILFFKLVTFDVLVLKNAENSLLNSSNNCSLL